MGLFTRAGVFVRRHKHAEEAAAEAVGVNIVWRLIAPMVASGAAAAAITAVATQTTTVYHPTFPLSTKGSAFVARNEGVRLTPYWDGAVACTVGVGHLIHYGGCTPADFAHWTLTLPQAMTLLMHDSTSAQSCVDRYVTRHITVPQSDALIDFTFNVGCGNLERSNVLRTVNAGTFSSVPAALSAWVYAGGVRLAGLATRRGLEAALFTRGYYGAGLGYFTPPKPLTPAQKAALAKAAAEKALRGRTGYWAWLAWYLHEGAWKPYPARAVIVRPHVPEAVPAVWWRLERAFVKARS